LFAFGLSALACQKSPSAKMQGDLQVFEREQSADKLEARGRAFAAMGDTTRAEQYFAAALDVGGDEYAITRSLLSVCVRDGRYRMAIEYARRHLVHHPNDDKVRFILGTLYAAVGEGDEAEAAFRIAAKTDGDNADLHYALAVVLRDQRGDPMQADGEFREYLRISPSGEHAEEARASLLVEVR
jgi:tetratricopeptide (TPR) repeat protein